MKIGDYVRFDYHRVSTPIQIAKIIEIHYDSKDDSNCYSTDIGLVIDKSNLVKESTPNIIDLIEDGDYVNGLPVRFKEKNRIDIGQAEDYFWLKNEHIKSIVTHEQFKSMEYKVGDTNVKD